MTGFKTFGSAMGETGSTLIAHMRVAPWAMLGSRRALRLVERNALVYRRGWVLLVSGLFEPFFYLLSIGLGLSHLVGAIPIGARRVSYAQYVAPGLLATAAMNGAIFDSTINIFFKLKIAKVYDAVLATPLTPGDLSLGELSWSLIRGGLYAAAFLVVMTGLGDTVSWWAVACLPAALVISLAFSGAGLAASSYMRSWQDFDLVMLVTLPLFLFSGVFFPLAVYPGWLQLLVRCTPLYQGVALVRGLDAGTFSATVLAHALYLGAMGAGGLWVTSRRFTRILLR